MTPVDRSNEAVAAFRLSWLLAVLMALQALFGLSAPSLYRDQGFVRATWFGNDLVTLVAAVPLLAAGLLDERRGRVRARLLWIGGLGYGVYNYAFYLLAMTSVAVFPNRAARRRRAPAAGA